MDEETGVAQTGCTCGNAQSKKGIKSKPPKIEVNGRDPLDQYNSFSPMMKKRNRIYSVDVESFEKKNEFSESPKASIKPQPVPSTNDSDSLGFKLYKIVEESMSTYAASPKINSLTVAKVKMSFESPVDPIPYLDLEGLESSLKNSKEIKIVEEISEVSDEGEEEYSNLGQREDSDYYGSITEGEDSEDENFVMTDKNFAMMNKVNFCEALESPETSVTGELSSHNTDNTQGFLNLVNQRK
jgi:hypothetical protein